LPSFLSRERKRSGASAVGTLSGRSRLIARPPLILATFVASALLAWFCSQSTFACGLRARRQPPRTRVLNMPRRASKRKKQRVLLHRGFAKLFSKKASIKPRQRSGATVRFLCRAFFLVKESGYREQSFFLLYRANRTGTPRLLCRKYHQMAFQCFINAGQNQ